jgi:hypothetical protein
MEHKHFFRQVKFILPISLFILLIASPIGAQTDYPMKVVTPNYIEANTVLPLSGNDASLQVALPFPFTFYGTTYNQAYVSTNGYLNFLPGAPHNNSSNLCSLPRSASPNGSIYAFWDDLDVDGQASVRTESLGASPKRFVIEWRNVTFNEDFVNRIDFEIVLYETGAILLQYRNIALDVPRERGSSATIGLENPAGDAAVQFSCNTSAIEAGEFAIAFGKLAKDVPVDIKPRACPNPLNLANKGVLPVAILGTADLDVKTIDPATVTLNGIAPLRWKLEDAATPYEPFVGKTDIYQCNTRGPDGNLDIVFKFDTEEVAEALVALGDVTAGQALILKLDGKLKDGTEIKGEDSVIIIRGHHAREHEREHEKKHEKEHDKKHDKDHEKKHDKEHEKEHDRDKEKE